YHAYYGKRLTAKKLAAIGEPKFRWIGYHGSDNKQANFQPEFSFFDGYNIFENVVKASFSDGVRSLDLVYSGHKAYKDTLEVVLKDRKYRFSAVLKYRIHYNYNMLEKSVIYRNDGKKIAVKLEDYNSGSITLPAGNYNLATFYGGWIKEMTMSFGPLKAEKKIIESRTGQSSHIFNPSFFLTREDGILEEKGEYFYGQLLWGGGHKISFERRFYDVTVITAGVNSFDAAITLRPGCAYETPGFLLGYSDRGTGKMSRQMHDFYRDNVIPKDNINDHNRVLVNSWEAFYFSINEEKLLKLADRAKEAGAEILVVDDGWFRRKDNDRNSLGDWFPVREKFPHGMKWFGKQVKAKGLKFGIWLEPECVNTDSEIYRKHPDWVYHFPGRPRYQMRNTLVLDLRKKEVVEYLKKTIKRVITEYDPDYVKWDMNRYISETGPGTKDESPYVEHVNAACELMDYLKSLKPGLILEGCAGGGGRMSGGYLAHVDQMWASDNNDPFMRQYIQYGTSLFYPAQVMCCHVADSPYNLTGRASKAEYRIRTAMAGNFGTEANLLEWNRKDLSVLKENISVYKSIRDIIYRGDLYRLENPYAGERVSFMYVSKDKASAVLFAYNNGKGAFNTPKSICHIGHFEGAGRIAESGKNPLKDKIRLAGLRPGTIYEVEIEGKKMKSRGIKLMKTGLKVDVNKPQDSAVIIMKHAEGNY
ncbi:MAG TPA: alpha-galactosidase, partial [Candidatus Goldiibacteriota bacterium]|nr:alpha-galactosidase [Candidatus Goldiibacteriota bacterium]